jgi:hypothetical protein
MSFTASAPAAPPSSGGPPSYSSATSATRIVLPEGTRKLELAESSGERRKYETMENLFTAVQTMELVLRYRDGASGGGEDEDEKFNAIFADLCARFNSNRDELIGRPLYPGAEEEFSVEAFLLRYAPDEEDASQHMFRRAIKRFAAGVSGVGGGGKKDAAILSISSQLVTALNELEYPPVTCSGMKQYFEDFIRYMRSVPMTAEFKANEHSKLEKWLRQMRSMAAGDIFSDDDVSEMKMELSSFLGAFEAMLSS